jgi:hypothetical protein
MKKILVLILFFATSANAQFVRNGFYYLVNSEPDIFGKGFHTPNGKIDPLPSGSDFTVGDDYLDTHNSSLEATDVTTDIKDKAFTSLFNSNTNVNIKVQVHGLKLVSLKPDYWFQMTNKSYYVYQGLRADSVTITGKIIDGTKSGSKIIEQVIGLVTGTATLANKIVGLFSKDTTNSMGIIHFGHTNQDSISVTLKDSTIFFAVRYAQPTQNIPKYLQQSPVCSNDVGDVTKIDHLPTIQLDGSNSLNLLLKWPLGTCSINTIANPLSITETFTYDPVKKQASVSLRKRDFRDHVSINNIKPFFVETNDVINGKISFDNTYPLAAYNQPNGNNLNSDFMVFCDYKLEFDAATNQVTIYNYQAGSYQTDIWMVPIKLKFFPYK